MKHVILPIEQLGRTVKTCCSAIATGTEKKLKPGDRDSYSVEDEITKFELNPAGDFTVWITSEWISE